MRTRNELVKKAHSVRVFFVDAADQFSLYARRAAGMGLTDGQACVPNFRRFPEV